jgi:acyl-CoA synthetase (AMP-forming)/AMP-acid ligase II
MATAMRPSTLPSHLSRYQAAGAWRGKTVAVAARELALQAPDLVVFPGGAAEYDAARLVAEAEWLAASLVELGIQSRDVVSFQLPNWHEAAIINLACALIGAVATPIVPIYRDAEVGQMLADSGSRLHFSAETFRGFDYAAMLERLQPALSRLVHIFYVRGSRGVEGFEALVANGRGRPLQVRDVASSDVKLLLYTSGTTGRPKGVLHSHDTLTRFIDNCVHHWNVQPGELLLMPSPVTHITGYGFGLEMPFLAGTRTLLMEVWNAVEAARLIDEHCVVGTVSATPFLQELADTASRTGTRLPTLRFFGCGGAAVPPDLIRSANATFAQSCAFRVFGCSEAPMVTLGWLGRHHAELAATTDGEIHDYEVRIVDESGVEQPGGTPGEILVRGPAMFMGYADDVQTREAISADGFFRTGDIGLVTEDGAIIVTGRKKDLIIRGGENISPKEIEDVLHRLAGVAEAAVVSMPHTRLGEGVCAYIVTRPGHSLEATAVIAHVAASGLARQKCPERVEIVDALPKTASGKVRKDLLREDIRQRLSTNT